MKISNLWVLIKQAHIAREYRPIQWRVYVYGPKKRITINLLDLRDVAYKISTMDLCERV